MCIYIITVIFPVGFRSSSVMAKWQTGLLLMALAVNWIRRPRTSHTYFTYIPTLHMYILSKYLHRVDFLVYKNNEHITIWTNIDKQIYTCFCARDSKLVLFAQHPSTRWAINNQTNCFLSAHKSYCCIYVLPCLMLYYTYIYINIYRVGRLNFIKTFLIRILYWWSPVLWSNLLHKTKLGFIKIAPQLNNICVLK